MSVSKKTATISLPVRGSGSAAPKIYDRTQLPKNGVGVGVGVGVIVGVDVAVGVLVGSGVGVLVGVGVGVNVGVAVGTGVLVGVSVGVGVLVAVGVDVGVAVGVAVGTGVCVGTGVLVGNGVYVGRGVLVGNGVYVGGGVGGLVGTAITAGTGVAVGSGSGSPHAANASSTMANRNMTRPMTVAPSRLEYSLSRRAPYTHCVKHEPLGGMERRIPCRMTNTFCRTVARASLYVTPPRIPVGRHVVNNR